MCLEYGHTALCLLAPAHALSITTCWSYDSHTHKVITSSMPLLYVTVRQVVSSYGYLDRVEHGPAFVSELLDAVLRYLVGANHRRTRPPGAGALEAAGAGLDEAHGLPVEVLHEGNSEDEGDLDSFKHHYQQGTDQGADGQDVGEATDRDQELGSFVGGRGDQRADEGSLGPSVDRPRSQAPLARVGQHDLGVTVQRRGGAHHRHAASTAGRELGRLKEASRPPQAAAEAAQAQEPRPVGPAHVVAALAAVSSRGAFSTAGEPSAPDSTRAAGAAGAMPQRLSTAPSAATSLSAVSAAARCVVAQKPMIHRH